MPTSETNSSMVTSPTTLLESFTTSATCCHPTIPVKTKKHWPFLYYQEDGKMFMNKAEKRSRYEEANDVGEALL